MNPYLVQPNKKLDLTRHDPDGRSQFDGSKSDAQPELEQLNTRLTELQELFYAENKHRLLIVLQAIDTGGKDGTIRRVFSGVNPQGVRVASFKVPTHEELAHDYLWRIHKHVPGNGEIVIFNRSHYEDVLVVRVHNLVPPEDWAKRYQHINDFERLLADTGTTILKFFLHIDLDEQKKRLQSRLDRPDKHWKFSTSDLAERKRWPDYMDAFQDALQKTSTDYAPWYVIPANRKWYRDLVISRIIVETLEGLNMQYPPSENLDGIVID
jgi:PPK2 family polyphosphate:nucleotide phosphotransferase